MAESEFPGFETLFSMLNAENGMEKEEGWGGLAHFAHDHLPEYLARFQQETDLRLRRILLDAISEVNAPEVIPVLAEALVSEDETLPRSAEFGLWWLDVPEQFPFLLECLHSREPKLQLFAMRRLKKVNTPEA